MNGIILYRSSSGSTKQYAEWIHEETGFPVHDTREKNASWKGADPVVIGCPVIANKPFLKGWIANNWNDLKGKNVALFTTSGADPATEPVLGWVENAFPEAIRSGIQFFPLPGRFDYAKLRGMNKAMIWGAGVLLGNKDVKNQMKNPVDGVAKERLSDLLDYLRSLSG